MSVDFEKIPEYVFDLFAEIMWADPENRGREVTLKPNDRARAYGVAWGWNPPLMEVGDETSLTHYGLAAHAWRQLQSKGRGGKQRKRRQSDTRALTAKQAEAIQIVGECQGDIAKAARRLGKDRKTIKQHYEAGMTKLGQATGRKPDTKQLTPGLRGQYEVTGENDSRARIKPVDRRRSN